MKVLFVFDSGSNCLCLRRILDLQTEIFKDFSYTLVRLPQYIDYEFDQNTFDILIYQTFPDENHPFKFNTKLIKEGDDKFLKFKGNKILMDSFDDGNRDAFSRMEGKDLPRIKCVPSWSFLKEFNVIFDIPPYFGIDSIPDMEDGKRDIILHYAPTIDAGVYHHEIRGKILDILRKEFNREVNFTRIPRKSYPDFLKRTQMSITGPGFGPCSNTFWTAMQYGTLSVVEETVDKYKMLPRVKVTPGEDYISFSLDTLVDKLRYLIGHPDECDRIRQSGYRKIKEGYNLVESAKEFHQVLENL